MKYIYKNGKFIKDPNVRELGKKAVTVWTGAVFIMENLIFDRNTNKYTGEHNGELLTLRPSSIIDMVSI